MITLRPAVTYHLSESGLTVFDCRWTCARRMGIGDRVVVVAALQQLQRCGYNVAALRNAEDEPLFSAGAIPAPHPISSCRYIPWTGHVMEVPLGMTLEDCEKVDDMSYHPIERALWGLGLDFYAEDAFALSLVSGKRRKLDVVAWMPIEYTRAQTKILPNEWQSILEGKPGEIVLWCALHDQPAAMELVRGFPADLARRISLRSASSLNDWIAGVESAREAVVPNSGGLWIGIGAGVPLTIVQRPPYDIPHQRMWQAYPHWFENPNAHTFVSLPDFSGQQFPRHQYPVARNVSG